MKYSYKPMEKKIVPSNRQYWVPSGIQPLKLYLLGVIFAQCQLKTADLLLNNLTNQLSKLYKHMDSVAIVLKQVEKFLIISLKIHTENWTIFVGTIRQEEQENFFHCFIQDEAIV